MKFQTLNWLALSFLTFCGGMAVGTSLTESPPELQELESCAIWNRAQLQILSNSENAKLGFHVERDNTGSITTVSCVRRPNSDAYGNPR